MRASGAGKAGRGRRVVQLPAAVPERILGMRNAGVDGPVGKDEALEQRVRGEAVGAMEPRARDLAAGVEPWHAGLAEQARLHTTASVMLGGDDRDGVAGYVDAELGALASDVGEVGEHFVTWLVADVEQYVITVADTHLH